ncbi:MAG: dihydroneopterin aldolase [Pseudonocardiaceae bacterium]
MTCTLAQSRDPVVPGELARTDDVIEVDELRLRCVIGINREERRDRQDVVISLRIGTDARPAVVIDCKDAVWNYRTATKAIIAHVESSMYLTVEKLTSEIARIVVVDHAAPWVEVRVHKPGALRFAASVGVVIHRRPGDFLGTPQTPSVTVPAHDRESGQ